MFMFDSLKNLLGTGGSFAAVGAIILASWNYIKVISHYLIGLVIGTSILKDEAGQAAMSFSYSRSLRSPLGQRVFGGYESYVHPKHWSETVAYESINKDPVLIRYGKQFALLSLASNVPVNEIGDTRDSWDVVRIRYFRWFFDIEKFTIDAIEYLNSQKRRSENKNKKKNYTNRFKIIRYSGSHALAGKSRIEESKEVPSYASSPTLASNQGNRIDRMIMMGVYRLLKWSREDLQMKPEEGHSPFTGYPFPDEVGEAIKELNTWLANEKWFRSKSIPWRRGWLLHGQPGSGKSTLVRSLGMFFDLPLFIFDLSTMTNNDFVDSWDTMMSNTPCIALIEDIDAIFDGRTYIGSSNLHASHLTFDCLLNCISGVKPADGIFLIVTTNHIEKLDPALGIPDITGKSSRPGRIDRVIHLGLMLRPQRLLLAKHILSDYPELIEETVELGEGETAAQFQSRCASLALSKFWADDKFLNNNTKVEYKEVIHFNNSSENKIPHAETKIWG